MVGAFFLTMIGGSTEAFGQQSAIAKVTPAVLGVPAIAAPQSLSVTPQATQAAPAAAAPQPAAPVSATAAVAREAAWLANAGWHLGALVDRFSAGAPLDEEANCIAVAV